MTKYEVQKMVDAVIKQVYGSKWNEGVKNVMRMKERINKLEKVFKKYIK